MKLGKNNDQMINQLTAERDRLRLENSELRQERDRLTSENVDLHETIRAMRAEGSPDRERTQRLAQENADLREQKEAVERERRTAHDEMILLHQDRDKWKSEARKVAIDVTTDPSEDETVGSIRNRAQRCSDIANNHSKAYLKLKEKANERDALKDEPKGKNSFITFTRNFGDSSTPNRYTYVAVKVDDTPGKGWHVTGRSNGPQTWQQLKSRMEDGKFEELTRKGPTSDASWSTMTGVLNQSSNYNFFVTNPFA